MSFDNSTLLRVTAQDIVNGIRNEGPSFVDLVCTNKTRKAIKGTEPYRSSTDTMGKDLGGRAIGETPPLINQSLSSIDWDMLRYHAAMALDQSELTDLSQYFEPLGEFARDLVQYVDVSMELDLQALLTDSNFNGQHAAANGAWSANTSTPILDIQECKRLDVPNPDMAILGATSAAELARHPDITGKVFNYSGGGAIAFSALKGIVAEILGIAPANVYIWSTFYNTAKFGVAGALGRVAGDFFWCGRKEGLLKIEQENSGQVTTSETHLKTELAYSRTVDFLRVDTFLGGEITGL